MKTLGWFALIVSWFGVSACTPTIESIEIADLNGDTPPMQGMPIAVSTDVRVERGGAGIPEVSIKPYLEGNEAFQQVGTLPNRNDPANNRRSYSGEISGQNYGGYDLRLRVPYSAWLTTQYVSQTLRFSVGPPEYCFGFITDSELGFAASAVHKSNGDVFGEVNTRWRPQNWPFDSQHDGSLSIQVLDGEFPRPPDEQYYWFVDFVSNSLVDIEQWAQGQGIMFHAASRQAGIYAQPIFFIRDAETLELMEFAPEDTDTEKFLVYPISTSDTDQFPWVTISWQSELFPEGVLEKVHIRMYGDAGATANLVTSTIYLDSVCPIPPGIEAPGLTGVTPEVNPWQ